MQEKIKNQIIENATEEFEVETRETDALIETLWTIRQRVNCFA